MPAGHKNTAISNGHAAAVHATSSFSGPRGRPGCTRYQWPSSIASLTLPRNTAPTSRRAAASRYGPPANCAAASRPIAPKIGATRSSAGGNSGPRSRVVVAGAADHRGDACPARGAHLFPAAHPGRAPLHRHCERDHGRGHARHRPRSRRRRAPRPRSPVRNTTARTRGHTCRTRCGSASRSRG